MSSLCYNQTERARGHEVHERVVTKEVPVDRVIYKEIPVEVERVVEKIVYQDVEKVFCALQCLVLECYAAVHIQSDSLQKSRVQDSQQP